MVVFFHFTMGRPQAQWGFKYGCVGVELFFILSGFVIFMSLNKVANSTEFIINRASRLYPTYWASVTFTFIVSSLHLLHIQGHVSLQRFFYYLGNLTMFQFYMNIPNFEDPYWTLIIEMTFYIIMVVLFRLKWLHLLDLFAGLSCLAMLVMTHFFNSYFWVNKFIIWFQLLQYIPLFWAGSLFYKICSTHSSHFKYYFLIAFCLICQLLMFPHRGRLRTQMSLAEYSMVLTFVFSVFSLFVAGHLKWIVNKSTLFFGKISFALYLVHQSLSLHILIPYFTDTLNVNFWITILFITFPVVVAIASCITFYIETPLIPWMKEKLRELFLKQSGFRS